MKYVKWIICLAMVLSTQVSKADKLLATAEFDHAYWLVVQGCNATWHYASGKKNIRRAFYQGCMGENNVRIFVHKDRHLNSYDQPRIDQIEYPDRSNNYTLRALIVEPAQGSNTVTVEITSNGSHSNSRGYFRRGGDPRSDRGDGRYVRP
jgi:hypothetical protein